MNTYLKVESEDFLLIIVGAVESLSAWTSSCFCHESFAPNTKGQTTDNKNRGVSL